MENEVNILAEEKPKTIKLADGKDYTLPPIDLLTLANMEKTLAFPLREFGVKVDAEPMQTFLSLVYALLKENYPNLTKDEAGRLVTLKELANLSSMLADILSYVS